MSETNIDFEDARWRRLVEADAAEEPLSDDDREFLERYEPKGASERAERELLAALGALGRDDDDAEEAANSPLVNATVRAYLADAARPEDAPVRRWPWVVGLTAVAATAAAVWVGTRAPEPAPPPGAAPGTVAQVRDTAPTDPEPAAPDTAAPEDPLPPSVDAPDAVRVASGTFLPVAAPAGAPALPPDAVVADATLQVGSARACLAYATGTACFDPNAQLRVTTTDDVPTVEVVRGRAEVTVGEPLASTMFVQVAGDRYEVQAPVTLVISVTRASKVRVEVTEGTATVRDADGTTIELAAPAVRGSEADAKPDAAAPVADAKTLLERARDSRARGDTKGAIAAYLDLVTHHDDAPAAAPAMVSLAELYLARGQAAQALKWFDRYVARGDDTLAEEAQYGRIKALRKLGRDEAADRAVDAFKSRYPASTYVGKLE